VCGMMCWCCPCVFLPSVGMWTCCMCVECCADAVPVSSCPQQVCDLVALWSVVLMLSLSFPALRWYVNLLHVYGMLCWCCPCVILPLAGMWTCCMCVKCLCWCCPCVILPSVGMWSCCMCVEYLCWCCPCVILPSVGMWTCCMCVECCADTVTVSSCPQLVCELVACVWIVVLMLSLCLPALSGYVNLLHMCGMFVLMLSLCLPALRRYVNLLYVCGMLCWCDPCVFLLSGGMWTCCMCVESCADAVPMSSCPQWVSELVAYVWNVVLMPSLCHTVLPSVSKWTCYMCVECCADAVPVSSCP
jgi:hypothetical protein